MSLEITNDLSPRDRSTGVALVFDSTRKLYSGVEKVTELNVQTVKTSLSEQHALTQAALSSQSLHEMIDLQTQQVPAAVTKHFAYWQHVSDIAVQTQSELMGLVRDHVDNVLSAFGKIADTAAAETAAVEEQLIAASPLAVEPVATGVTEPVVIVDSTGNALH